MGFTDRLLRRIPNGKACDTVADCLDGVNPRGTNYTTPDGGYVDLPVPDPQGHPTTAWSNGVHLFTSDAGIPLWDVAGCGTDVEAIWRTQPNVRKVIDFISRNIANIPLHLYERVSDTDRVRVRDDDLAHLLANPAPHMTANLFWKAVIADGLLYDRWCVWKTQTKVGQPQLVRIPARRFRFKTDRLDRVTGIVLNDGDNWWRQDERWLDLDEVIFDYGYSPSGAGYSPIHTLASILAEQQEAMCYRRQIWANGTRAEHWLEVPPEADEAGFDVARFEAEYRARFTGRGSQAGGVPLLRDGVKLHETKGFTAQDMQDLEARKLTAIEVAAAFHIAPELVGAREGNFSNIREFRQMLYRDSLGAYISAWEQAVNLGLSDMRPDGRFYVEANIESKLRGDFYEQAQYLQHAVGRPWMTADEARARLNMPAIGGDADKLVTPLNVLVGGQASPRDSGSQNLRARFAVKMADQQFEHLAANYTDEVIKLLWRQEAAILSALGAKAAWADLKDVWDKARWDTELREIILRYIAEISYERAAEVAAAFDSGEWNPAIMDGWLDAVATNTAADWNQKTLDDLVEASRKPDWKQALKLVFAVAISERAKALADTTQTDAGNFGANEAAKQAGVTYKIWLTKGGNPRPSHAAMNGEAVPMGDYFSNGGRWPGDARLSDEERVNCRCEIEFGIEEP